MRIFDATVVVRSDMERIADSASWHVELHVILAVEQAEL